MTVQVDIQTASAEPVPEEDDIRSWVIAALDGRIDDEQAQVSIRLVDSEEMTALNETYRGKNGPTNVLSFPADLPGDVTLPLLGDIVICAPVVHTEAQSQGKTADAHWAHMTIHGTLHLLGFDHEQEDEAATMEALETAIPEQTQLRLPLYRARAAGATTVNDQRSANEPDDRSWIDKIALLFSSEPRNRNDLEDVLRLAAENEVIDEDAHSIMEGAMQVSDMQVRDIMIPRSQMKVIKAETPLDEILPEIIRSKHSRYPVIGESHDDVLGILLAKDLLPQILKSDHDDFSIEKLLRPTTVVPESKRLNVLLTEFRENRNHMAIVIDEYGGVAGLVTIEDVLEEIVGEIEDETDALTDRYIRELDTDDYLVKALTPIEDFNGYFDSSLSNDEFDTIGGLVIHALGHMPKRNEVANIDDYQFKVVNADQRKIYSLRVRPIAQ